MTEHFFIYNAHILAEEGDIPGGWVRVENGTIAAMGQGDLPALDLPTINAEGHTLAPGFIDAHVHGGDGHEVMDATPEALRALSAFYARHGVTSFLATTWTAAREPITAALNNVAACRDVPLGGARMLGAHVEGPYISPKKPGAQSPHLIRPADPDEFAEWLSTGVIRLMTVAPEIEANRAVFPLCAEHGIRLSAGHTDATYDEMVSAVDAGITQTTHTFNAMRPLHHREPGTVGAAMSLSALRCEVIADGVHVHPAMVDLLFRVKGASGLMLITDAVRGAGLPVGTTYPQDGRTVTVRDAAYLDEGTLAGSTLTMDVAVRNLCAFTGRSLADVWPCASLTPAQALGVDDRTGSIRTGKDADFVLLDADLRVLWTMVGGEIVDPFPPKSAPSP